jgi:CheY-like chemotaxis protein
MKLTGPERRQTMAKRTTPTPPTGRAVLVIDDEQLVLNTVRENLTALGFLVFTASSRSEGMEIWTHAVEQIGYILMDATLSGEGQCASWADRFLRDKPSVKIVFTSGFSKESLTAMGQGLPPAAVFLQKPFDTLALTRTFEIPGEV